MEQLSVDISNKAIIKMVMPISVALFIPQASFFTNNVFMGMLGQRELGVSGITGVFYLILSMIGYGLSSGVQIQMARRAGEENKARIAETFMNGLVLSIALSGFLIILSMWLVPVLFSYSLNDTSNLGLSVGFMFRRIWGLPFLIITQLLSSFFISIGRTRLLMYGSLVTTFVNILLDYLFIFGHWGFPAMGFNGAAIASVLAEVVYCIAMVAMFFANGLQKDYPVFRYLTINVRQSVQSLKVAAPLIVQFMFSIGGWLVFFFFIEHLGSQALAGSQMLRSIFGVLGVGTWALATTCNTMVSNIIGQGRHHEVAAVVKKIATLSFLYAVALGILLLVFPRQFLGIYSSDEALITYTIPSLQVIVAATLITSLSTVAFNAVVGTGNTLVNLTMEITCVGLYLVYCYYFIYLKHAPLYICWGSEFVYWTLLLIGSVWYLRSGKWRAKSI